MPCFDQPSLKASLLLSIKVKKGWTALANTPKNKSEDDED